MSNVSPSRCHGQTNWINIEIPPSTAAYEMKPNCFQCSSVEVTGPIELLSAVSPHNTACLIIVLGVFCKCSKPIQPHTGPIYCKINVWPILSYNFVNIRPRVIWKNKEFRIYRSVCTIIVVIEIVILALQCVYLGDTYIDVTPKQKLPWSQIDNDFDWQWPFFFTLSPIALA